VAALCAALVAAVAPQVDAQAVDAPGTSGNARVIVKLKADSPVLRKRALSVAEDRIGRAEALGQRLGFPMAAGAAISERAQVVFATGITSAELAQRLARESDVEYAVPDRRQFALTAPNDPLYASGVPGNGPAVGQWYLRAPAGIVKSSLDVETAWNVTHGSPGIVVAVVDSGVRFDHPDLLAVAAGGNLLPGYDMISDVDVANDGDGRDGDASDPGDWVTQAEISNPSGPLYQCARSPNDSRWHGTKVSGLIAALTDNGVGMASVGRNVRVLPVRAAGKCGGYESDIIAGMRWAAGLAVAGVPANPNRARVINLSLGGDGECSADYKDAIAEINAAGTVIVAAGGNSNGHAVTVPANCDGVIAVAGLRHAGTKVGFSAVGLEIAVSAPAGNCVNTAANSPCVYPILTTSNSGTTNPANPIYTDSYNTALGTSFSAPLVAGTAALMLSAQPSLTPSQVKLLIEATARPFPTTGGDNTGAVVTTCAPPKYDALGNPVDQLECYCTIDTCGAGMLDAGAAVLAASAGMPATGVEVEGLWWNAPGESESGWGINLAHQGSVIFATWFTYDATGKAWWLSMRADRVGASPDTYAGQLIETRGPPFNAVPFDANLVTRTVVGSGTLTFADVDRGTFSYTVNGTRQTKTITRQAFGPPPTCVYSAQPDFGPATNFQDLWWNAPANSESGWGVNVTHQGDNLFATWFTYDVDGAPLWLSVSAPKTAAGEYGGQLIRTSGPAFNADPFSPAQVTRTVVGTATFTFANGSAGTFDYTVNGARQTKQITRELFAAPAGTLCR
jgi:serine protease